jgi:16S rRNA (cytosine967-C5)-methyltransferase
LIRWKTYLGFVGDKPITWINRLRVYESNKFQWKDKTPVLEEEQMPEHVKVSCPKPLFELLRAAHGPELAMKIAKVQNEEPKLTVRANTLRTTRKDLMREFKGLGWNVRATEHAPNGIRFMEPPTGNLFALA